MRSAEHDRLIGNMVMIGVIAELDEANALVRVDVDGLKTDWIPFVSGRAGPGVREWSAPEPGEQVVMVSPYGDPSQGVVIGSIYQASHAAPAQSKEKHRTEYSDGTVVEYDRATKRMTIDVGEGHVYVKCKSSRVVADSNVELDTPTVHCTGSITAEGNLAAGTGASGTFTTATGGVVTVERGIITNIF